MISVRESKKYEQEKKQLESFLEKSRLLPSPQMIMQGENPPDFVLCYEDRKISVEITELYKKSGRKYSERQVEAEEDKILTCVQKKLEEAGCLPIEVLVFFDGTDQYQRGYAEETIKVLSNLIIQKIKYTPHNFEEIIINRDEINIDGIRCVKITNGIYRNVRCLSQLRVRRNKIFLDTLGHLEYDFYDTFLEWFHQHQSWQVN